ILAAFTPWLTQDGRLGFEVSAMIVLLAAGLCALSGTPSRARFLLAGLLFALAIFGYSSARLQVALFAAAFAATYGLGRSRDRGWWLVLVPVVLAYVTLESWNVRHPGALTARFDLISIAWDGAGFATLCGRFVLNFLSYFSPDFLFITGDHEIRHNTAFSGMLLVITFPLLLAGLWAMWSRRREPLARFLFASLVLSPIAGAVLAGSVR